jgi:hypothetical protein
MEGAMLRAKLWNKSVSRVELDQRARDARLRLERIERQLLPRALTRSPLRRLLYLRVPVERDHGFRWKMITQSGGT